ncbi:nucleotidyltransferase [Roseburia sp. 499]|uniref:nucleotidyltransferase n=1 Tax=Roseburia sp. 499 TaxID=1261634 RepID=UPI00095365BA|nr:nucleotidyltransferase [Roseburia sp. 499]WVK70881.1 nucleotidyltransferase [Roseburia sp. 499]
MNVLGIIAEYNPFHYGHAYQIKTLKKQTNADYVIIAMSGNFVQRGAPALLEKYTRAHMALKGGADLVLELPVLYASASAEYFAKGGVSLLHNTGVVTHLGFGTENDNLSILQKISDILLKNPLAFQEHLQQELKNGLSFPAARAKALETVFSVTESDDATEVNHILASPNNILAIEYLKALASLSSSIQPVPLLRKGKGYHDTEMSEGFCSASAIRKHLHDLNTDSADRNLEHSTMPEYSFELLTQYPHTLLFEDDFSQLVHYKLLTESPDALATYADSSPELANRMYRARHSFTSWSQFCELLKTKNTTYTRISRLLLHLILNIKSTDYGFLKTDTLTPYFKLLGFRKSAAPLLSSFKETGKAPLITNISDAENQLSADARSLLQLDITASDLYHLALTAKGNQPPLNDYRHPLVIIP